MTGTQADAADVVAVVPIGAASTAAWLTIHGRSIVDLTIEALRAVPRIRAIALALDGPAPKGLAGAFDLPDGPPVLRSRATRGRWSAMLAALDVAGDSRSVLVHEPDRPLVSPAAIGLLLDRPRGNRGLVVATSVVSTIKRVAAGRVVATVPREQFYVQQGQWLFDRRTFEVALRRAVAEEWDAGTEVELAREAGIPLEIVDGQPLNVPVTSPTDARFAELAIERRLVGSSPGWSA